jgi:Copper type II ascorbate-dependent monooxygenase, C-terminal domain
MAAASVTASSRAKSFCYSASALLFVAGCSSESGPPPQGGQPGTDSGATVSSPMSLEIHVDGVAPGVENTVCIKQRLGNPVELAIGRIVNEISSSSHHFVVSTVNEAQAGAEALEPFDCLPFRAPLSGVPLTITQKHLDEYTLPAGVGYGLTANQMMHLELHYINTTSEPVDIVGKTTLYPLAEGELQYEASVLLVGNLGVQIPPNSAHTLGPTAQVIPPSHEGVSFYGLTGHTHQYGTDVRVETFDAPGAAPVSRYALDNFKWDDPEVVRFDTPFQVPAGGGFSYTCSWRNPTNNTIVFGESANDEMCFFWAYYFPRKPGRPLLIASGN